MARESISPSRFAVAISFLGSVAFCQQDDGPILPPSSVTYLGYEALGCYEDSKTNRLMSYMTSFSGMYAQKCFDICQGEDPAYTHFGLQYRIECWCGVDVDEHEAFEDSKLATYECDMECATPSQTCGGRNKMNVYEMKLFEGVNPRVGCFNDALPRAMDATPKYTSVDLTRAMCQERCEEAGTEYYGLEYGVECWCGDEYDRHGEVIYSRTGNLIDDSCEERPCGGNSLEQCGGDWQLAVYRTSVPLVDELIVTPSPLHILPPPTNSPEAASYTGWEELGCYQDNEDDRLMPFYTGFSGMYRQKCFDICQGEYPGFTHFGLQDYYQCWCGIDTDEKEDFELLQLDDSECNEECATGGELCGGDTKMRVFELKKIDGVNPRVGCFYDGNPLAMDATPVYDSADMTKAMCQEHCAEAGTAYYGLAAGSECYCGDEYDKYGEIIYSPASGFVEYCEEEQCSGNPLEQCGGRAGDETFLAVYRTDVSLQTVTE